MGHDRAAPKRPVNMTLNEDLVRRVRRITPNLSETVERLLTEFVDDVEARAANWQPHAAICFNRHRGEAPEPESSRDGLDL